MSSKDLEIWESGIFAKKPTPYMAPAVQFEKTVTVATLAGISRSWLMPSPYAYAEIEDKIYHDIMCAPSAPPSHERLYFLFDELATLNPEIKPFRDVINKPRKLANFIYGMTSQYNLDDILYYNNSMDVDRTNLFTYIETKNILSFRAGASFGWMPSTKTLLQIKYKLDASPQAPAEKDIREKFAASDLRKLDFYNQWNTQKRKTAFPNRPETQTSSTPFWQLRTLGMAEC